MALNIAFMLILVLIVVTGTGEAYRLESDRLADWETMHAPFPALLRGALLSFWRFL